MARVAMKARGAAVVVAMLLAALAAVIGASLLWQQERWIGEHERRRDQVQAQALAMAGVQWARQIVHDNAPPSLVYLGQPWAFRLPATPIENGAIGGYITDAQAGLNANNLGLGSSANATHDAFARLLAEVGVPAAFLNALGDWVDADDRVSEDGGAEDSYYLAQSAPRLAANAPLRRPAELLAVRGADATLVSRLLPFVDAIDAPTAINVNTAPLEVLMAAVDGLDATRASALVASRAQAPFATVADFRNRLPAAARVDETILTVKSDWFIVSIEARQGDTVARARALLKRAAGATQWPSVIWETVE
ncbi:MAG TPA: type II secretion system minor pseudopilin GspK [Casimicrobiaceae bacterium]|nr:type II secretion system minor pseudopilin GspK [Casimicrobiaceae bacterium]